METWMEILEAHDGLELYCQTYPAKEPHGVIVTLHDYGEHSGVYTYAYDRMIREHFSVYTLDLRGHGKSPGERGYIGSFEAFLEDLDLLLARIKDRENGLPIFIMGSGLGALIAGRFAFTRKPRIRGLILCCPILDVSLTGKDRALAQYGKGFLAHLNVTDQVREQLLQPTFMGELKDDELVFRGAVQVNTVREILGATEAFKSDFPALDFAILTLAGAKGVGQMERLHDSFLTYDKTFHAYEGDSQHLLLHVERDQIIGDILEWCELHSGPADVDEDDEENDWENDAL